MSSLEWVAIEHAGESRRGKVLGEGDEWTLACIPDSEQSKDAVLFITGETIAREEAFDVPNSGDISINGTAVIADWREYGEQTQSDIHIIDQINETHESFEIDESSPLVSISPSGNCIAVSSWDETVRLYDVDTLSLQAKHSVLFGSRLVPAFVSDTRLQLSCPDQTGDLEYVIDTEGVVQHRSEFVETLRYAESFELDHTSDWSTAVPELVDLYRDSSSDHLRNRIANIIGEGSLAHISDASRLESIIVVVENGYEVFEDEYVKLAAQILADAHYRLAKARRDTDGIEAFEQQMQHAGNYATEVLPWYAGKQLLAKIHRRKARVFKQRNQRAKARKEINQLFELENEYGVLLTRDADKRLRDELT